MLDVFFNQSDELIDKLIFKSSLIFPPPKFQCQSVMFVLLIFILRSADFVSVEKVRSSRTSDGNTGWKVTAACQWNRWEGGVVSGGILHPIPVWMCAPSPSSGYPLSLAHIILYTLDSEPLQCFQYDWAFLLDSWWHAAHQRPSRCASLP